MKIFISHASANKEYGNALVELLRGVGLGEEEIIFTSNTAYGIPIGQNIFNWLKSQISEKPFVIYLLSKEYYQSIACLNEMGAAWIIENEHAILFTPDFDLSSKEFQNGAIDPREIGFAINNEERLISFIQSLDHRFTITKTALILHQQVKKYMSEVARLSSVPITAVPEKKTTILKEMTNHEQIALPQVIVAPKLQEVARNVRAVNIPNDPYQKFLQDVRTGKLKDSELILLHYIIDMSKTRLLTGWQEDTEVRKIHEWEEVNEIKNLLSSTYNNVIGKFEIRRYTDVSAFTGSGNPKEVKLKPEIEDHILYLPQDAMEIIEQVVEKNKIQEGNDDDDLPF